MKNKIFFISIASIFILALFNMNFVFNSGLSANLSLASIEALARGETLHCSICGEQIEACRCPPNITCSYADCHGKDCHVLTYNMICPCDPTGDPHNICPL